MAPVNRQHLSVMQRKIRASSLLLTVVWPLLTTSLQTLVGRQSSEADQLIKVD